MKYFICSDAHSNLRALDAVLEVYREEYPCAFIFLGDCIGYGPHPEACLERILNIPRSEIIMGNHEWALINKQERHELNGAALEAIEWTERVLPPRYNEVIRERFKISCRNNHLLAVHSSPFNPREWAYIHDMFDAQAAFDEADFEVCFIGHTHIPAIFTCFKEGEEKPGDGMEFTMESGERYIINPGSIGQPRDGDPRAAFCVLDDEHKKISFRRVNYDIAAEVEDFREAGLPEILAERLLIGA